MILAILAICAVLVLLGAAMDEAPQEVPVKRPKD
jgi:hypothetical protein